MMYSDFKQLERLDRQGGSPENIFINGSISSKRPDESVITPTWVAMKMIQAANLEDDIILLEPCAGQGGILKEVIDASTKYRKIGIYFNEKSSIKKTELTKKYSTQATPLVTDDSLYYGGGDLNMFDRIIMNPPFDNAINFIELMSEKVLEHGRLVTLFPKYQLARLTTNRDFILRILSSKNISIEDLTDFNCGYGAKVCMITIQF